MMHSVKTCFRLSILYVAANGPTDQAILVSLNINMWWLKLSNMSVSDLCETHCQQVPEFSCALVFSCPFLASCYLYG